MTKRQVPGPVKRLLDEDAKLTKSVFEWFDKKFGYVKYRSVMKQLEVSCHGLIWVFGTFALIYVRPSKMQTWVNLLYLLFIDLAIVGVLKAFTRRRRPSYNRSDMFATVSIDKFSFPSGHATRAIALFVFFKSLPFTLAFPILVWSIAVCISRVLLGRHHVLDVFAGMIIGYIEASFVLWTYFGSETTKMLESYLFSEDPWSSA